ncbi:MAG TPA: hypothetical protein VMH84_05760 [Xanthobacteraceae bacterium]|nr:hypothetical protein [Xanthobacteraceae bacterium]
MIYRIAQARFRNPRSRATSIRLVMNRIKIFAVLVAGFVLATPVRAQLNQTASADDTARFLAGMQLPSDSPLAVLSQDPVIQQQAASIDTAFAKVEEKQLSKIRAWSAANLTTSKPVMFYMFGGPDFLYANAFFPNATTYVLSGLEPVGQIPDILKLQRWSVVQALRNIQASLRNILTLSYFITAHMSQDLNAGPVNGTLPILYVFLARSGYEIQDVSLVHLDDQGVLQPGEGIRPWAPARGVKIIFSKKDGPQKTLYYFSTNLEDLRGNTIALLRFNKSLGQGDSFIKSASYLMHSGNFSQVRNFILDNSSLILQDDTGVPVRLFDTAKWQLRPYGRYLGPIPMFQDMYQSKLNELFQKNQPIPIDFGVGYRWYANESNLLLAIKSPGGPDVTASISQDASARSAEVVTEAPKKPAYRPASRPKDEFPSDIPFFLFPFMLLAPQPPQ